MTTMLDRLFGALAVITLSMTFTGTTNLEGDGVLIDWRAPSFSGLEASLRTCQVIAIPGRACFQHRTNMQHAYDAATDCFSGQVEFAACNKIKKALAADTDAFFRAIEYADLRGGLANPNTAISGNSATTTRA